MRERYQVTELSIAFGEDKRNGGRLENTHVEKALHIA
jgi:hypothetical protein